MKQLLFIILAVSTATFASAKCADNGIYLLSNNSVLNKNGLIILQFYASSQAIVEGLNTKYPIYLKSQNGKITLLALDILKGEMGVTQVILKPSSELTENEVYTLHIDNLPKDEQKPQRYNEKRGKFETPVFKISSVVDTEIPVLKSQPSEQKKIMIHYGCGPARWVYFVLSGEDKSELFVIATVKHSTNGLTTNYILKVENGIVKVGHGMCSGAFYFDDSDNYEITFQLFDQSGNKSSLANAISFTKPTVSTTGE